jgi:hypothetical protein
MTETGPVSETLGISNIPESMNNINIIFMSTFRELTEPIISHKCSFTVVVYRESVSFGQLLNSFLNLLSIF